MVYGAVPKVVIIVGPAGVATDRYRAEAKSAAALARKYTPDVVELYSPDATWPAATAALKNASLVIYMGHGNGWPSRYRDQLYPITQDGFGLNPVAGGGDDSHQYFGEASVGREVKLAKNAVVLLNHLCYASGNSEPGLPEGTLDQAKQRVDNYAAGFIRAGASAVIAEAWASPNYMVRAVLGGSQSVEAAWRDAPSALGNQLAFKSVRSSGFTAEMQTETASSGFGRSTRGQERPRPLPGACERPGISERRPAGRADRPDPCWQRADAWRRRHPGPADRREGGRSADPVQAQGRCEAAEGAPGKRSLGPDRSRRSSCAVRPRPRPGSRPNREGSTCDVEPASSSFGGRGWDVSGCDCCRRGSPGPAGRRHDRSDGRSHSVRPRRDGQRDDRYEDGHERDGGRSLRSPAADRPIEEVEDAGAEEVDCHECPKAPNGNAGRQDAAQGDGDADTHRPAVRCTRCRRSTSSRPRASVTSSLSSR